MTTLEALIKVEISLPDDISPEAAHDALESIVEWSTAREAIEAGMTGGVTLRRARLDGFYLLDRQQDEEA